MRISQAMPRDGWFREGECWRHAEIIMGYDFVLSCKRKIFEFLFLRPEGMQRCNELCSNKYCNEGTS